MTTQAATTFGPRVRVFPVMRFPSVFAFLVGLLFSAVAVHAQSVRWEPGSGTLAHNQLSELSLVFEQCDPARTVTPPAVPGLQFGTPNRSESTSFSVVNFQATSIRTVTLTYRVRPTEKKTLTIPAFTVETDKGPLRVPAATFEVGDATVGQTGLSVEDVAQSRFTLPGSSVWAGEVFPLTYTLNASKRYLYNVNREFEWNSVPLAHEPWPEPQQFEAMLNNDPRVSIVYRTRAYAKEPGDYALHPSSQLISIGTGPTNFGLFGRSNLTQLAITSPRVDLTVRPLPTPAPAGFAGAVGQFTLESHVVPATATVGEPITWTLTLDGTGNWPDIGGLPPRSVSKDFRVVQPQAKRVNKDNALFDATFTEDIVLIPTKPGSYTLGPVTFAIFNPRTGAYENLSTQPVTITVKPGAMQPVAGPESGSSNQVSDGTQAESAKPAPSTPPAPSAIPRDPLPAGDAVSAPLARPVWLTAVLSALLLPLLTWLALAFRRARLTDPARPQREARARLASTLGKLAARVPQNEQPESEATAALLLQWQRDTAVLWDVSSAVPTSASFLSSEWATLWAETDRSLYGAAPLPADWITRATQALAARRTPSFSPFQLFLPRNLLPLVVAALLLPSLAPDGLAATEEIDPVAAYARGEFATAEAAWTDTLQTAPTDWTARHNLALALLQQDHPGPAAGHALAAFVQQPQNPSVRWHLAYAFEAAGVVPTELAPFLKETPRGAIARLASPTRWQTVLIAAAWFGALAIAFGIYGAYQKRPRPGLVCCLLGFATLLGVVAALGFRTYGPLADARAVMVVTPTTLRSIPSDLDTTQKSSPLATGVIATADKTFLGWQRLVFADGQTGWVRTEAVVPLWR